ncbi:MAG TPA: CapA family protein [Bacteroides sp.]|nr:CapA family protein [Bacteroides sp.]
MKIAFLGDISFNDAYIPLYREGVDPFPEIGRKLAGCNLVVGNLECLSEGDQGEYEPKKPRLKTTRETLNFLKKLHVSAVTLAHNHVYDNLKDGFEKTVSFLEENNMAYLGAGLTRERAGQPLKLDRGGKKICMLSYLHEDTHPNLQPDCPVHVNRYDPERISRDIRLCRSEGFGVILLLHWGGRFEGGLYPDRYQRADARKFIRAGAGLVIGHHTHTLQPAEKIDGRWVFYSLGNFCFADIHFEGRIREMSRLRFRESVIPVVTIQEDAPWSMELWPVRNVSLEIKEAPGVLKKLKRRSTMHRMMMRLPILWILYRTWYRWVGPVWEQLIRKDREKTLIRRIFGLNLQKIKSLFKR